MDDKERNAIALWRLGVLGPLISARLEHGDRQKYFREAAARTHQRPDGRTIVLSARTIESWYQDYQRGGFEALRPQSRADRDRSRVIAPELAELIVRAKREKPRRSIRRIIRMLERAGKVRAGELSRSTVHRLLQRLEISTRPLRGPSAERRSFLHEHAGDLWIGDAMHGPHVVGSDGRLRKAYLLSLIDGATRFLAHSAFGLSEGAVVHEVVLKQALQKYGRPRAYYVDRGSAYIAHSLRQICAELGIQLLHAGPGDAEAKGAIERWHRTWREEVGDELPEQPLSLQELNARHWAWLSVEYHARKHDTTERIPREHWLSEVHELRTLPRNKNLDEVFLHRETRKVRKDGTVQWGGGLLEVRAELSGHWVELRFDPGDPDARPRVFLDDKFYCDTVPLDRHANATRARRRNLGAPAPTVEPTGIDPLAQMQDEHARRTASLSKLAREDDDETDEMEE